MRYLHTMLRIGNPERTLHFYCDILGFKLVRKSQYPQDKFDLYFVEAPSETSGAQIEFTYNYDRTTYNYGDGYGHIALAVKSIADIEQKLKAHGLKFSWGPGMRPGGKGGMAFVKDPDGYSLELLEE